MPVEIVSSKHVEQEYEGLLAESGDAVFHHTLLWRDVLRDVLADEAVYLALRIDGDVRAVLPGFIHTGAEGGVYNSLPWSGSYGGVVAGRGVDREDAARRLVTAARELAAEQGCIAANIIGSPRADDCEAYASAWAPEFVRSRVSQITYLDRDLCFSPSVRNHIRKAEGMGLDIDDCMDVSELPEFCDLHSRSCGAAGHAAKPLSFFVSLYGRGVPGGQARFMAARHEGRMVAALVLLVGFGGVTVHEIVMERESRHLQGPSLLLARALDWARDSGCAYWNWGASNPGSGVYNFKRAWGTKDVPYGYYTTLFCPPARLCEMGIDRLAEMFPWYYVAPFDAVRATREAALQAQGAERS